MPQYHAMTFTGVLLGVFTEDELALEECEFYKQSTGRNAYIREVTPMPTEAEQLIAKFHFESQGTQFVSLRTEPLYEQAAKHVRVGYDPVTALSFALEHCEDPGIKELISSLDEIYQNLPRTNLDDFDDIPF